MAIREKNMEITGIIEITLGLLRDLGCRFTLPLLRGYRGFIGLRN